ncbi:MAG: hypothetical protein E7495_08530 [Ruminococcus flavefaciens]|nr:hypothetical protein [Ruminococcus flavefaciens]
MKRIICGFAAVLMITAATSCVERVPENRQDQIIGRWDTEEEGTKGCYIFSDNGVGSIEIDMSSIWKFDGSVMKVEDFVFEEKDYTFQEGVLSADYLGKNFVNMKKNDGNNDSIEGSYTINSGLVYDTYKEMYANTDEYSLGFVKDGDSTRLMVHNCFTYEYAPENNVLKIIKGTSLFNNSEFECLVSDKEMKLSVDGAVQEFKKAG